MMHDVALTLLGEVGGGGEKETKRATYIDIKRILRYLERTLLVGIVICCFLLAIVVYFVRTEGYRKIFLKRMMNKSQNIKSFSSYSLLTNKNSWNSGSRI
jgi:hypothetical protein